MYIFEKINLEDLNVEEFNQFPNKSVLTTKEWIEFIEEDSNATPYILKITNSDLLVGYFSALIVKKFGLKIVGSPFPGWSTVYMGLDVWNTEEKHLILLSSQI